MRRLHIQKTTGGRREGVYHYDEIKPIPFGTIHVDHLLLNERIGS